MYVVRVELLNDDGEELVMYGEGDTVQDAVSDAEDDARLRTGDASYVMNEWHPAS